MANTTLNDYEIENITAALKHYVKEFSKTKDGQWLNDFDWEKIPVSLEILNGDVVGKYSFGKIILRECPEPKMIFATYVHELRHRWQFVKKTLLFIIGKLIRPLIENDAYKMEAMADAWIDSVALDKA